MAMMAFEVLIVEKGQCTPLLGVTFKSMSRNSVETPRGAEASGLDSGSSSSLDDRHPPRARDLDAARRTALHE
jgi:hypothetical protein